MSENMSTNESTKLTKKEVDKIWWTWFKYALTVFGYERLQAPGFTLSMLPIFQKYYANDNEKMVADLKRHAVFYNTNIKVGLMGPLAGIGDAITQATVPPIVLSIAIGLSANGSILGAVFAVVVLYVFAMLLTRFTFMQGYKSGQEAIHKLLGKQMAKIQDAMSVLGLTVVGAITASYVNFTITAQYTSKYSTINFQEVLDGIFPKLIPMCLVLLGFYLLKFKKFSAIKLIGVYLIISILLGLIGIV